MSGANAMVNVRNTCQLWQEGDLGHIYTLDNVCAFVCVET